MNELFRRIIIFLVLAHGLVSIISFIRIYKSNNASAQKGSCNLIITSIHINIIQNPGPEVFTFTTASDLISSSHHKHQQAPAPHAAAAAPHKPSTQREPAEATARSKPVVRPGAVVRLLAQEYCDAGTRVASLVLTSPVQLVVLGSEASSAAEAVGSAGNIALALAVGS